VSCQQCWQVLCQYTVPNIIAAIDLAVCDKSRTRSKKRGSPPFSVVYTTLVTDGQTDRCYHTESAGTGGRPISRARGNRLHAAGDNRLRCRKSEDILYRTTENDRFRQVRRRALWSRIDHWLRGRPWQLLSFDEVADRLHASCQSYVGAATVEVAKIAGSVGRHRDFDRAFRPLKSYTADRWRRIAKAHREGRSLPPVELYRVGDAYFVRDGHHRVSVVPDRGATHTEAEVIACQTRVPITPDVTEEELGLKAEYTEFLETTDLDQRRLSDPAGAHRRPPPLPGPGAREGHPLAGGGAELVRQRLPAHRADHPPAGHPGSVSRPRGG
jgi:hypothetical protein